MRAAALILLALAFCGTARGGTVYLQNEATAFTQAQLEDELPAYQKAVTEDFSKWWGVDAQLVALPLFAKPPAGSTVIHLYDDSTLCDIWGCALGYHDAKHGVPAAYVFARTSLEDSVAVSEVITHELFEMLADPFINRAVRARGEWWLVEVSDPVVNDRWFYPSATGKPVAIQSFVTPAWYGTGKGPFDRNLKIRKPFQLRRGGYVAHWDHGWTTLGLDPHRYG